MSQSPPPRGPLSDLRGWFARWGGLHGASGALLAAVSLSGLFIFAADLFTPGYFGVLKVHVALGLLLLVTTPAALALHLWRTGSPLLKSLLPSLAALAVPIFVVEYGMTMAIGSLEPGWDADLKGLDFIVARILVYLFGIEDGDGGFVMASAIHAGLLLLLAGVVVVLSHKRPVTVPLRWTGVTLTVTTLGALTSGLVSWTYRGDPRFSVMELHSLVGWIATVLLVLHFRAVRRLLRPWGTALATVAVMTLGFVPWRAHYDSQHKSGFDPDEIPGRYLIKNIGTPVPGTGDYVELDPVLMASSNTCGVSTCHPALTAEWEGSLHRHSADNEFFGRVAEQLVEEAGAGAVNFCAPCHDPVRSLAGTVAEDYATGRAEPSEGVSCVACHGIFDTHNERNGRMTVRQPIPYPGATFEEQRQQIHLDPRHHRQNMVVDGVGVSSELCGVCHRVQMGAHFLSDTDFFVQHTYDDHSDASLGPEAEDPAAEPPRHMCSDCHMPVLTPHPEDPSLELYSHRMVGINLDYPSYTVRTDADRNLMTEVKRHTRMLIKGRAVTGAAYPPKELFVPDPPDHQAMLRGLDHTDLQPGEGVLAMELDVRQVGGTVVVTVESTNDRAGHAFPLGPSDLQEVWLEVWVRDAQGRELAHTGALGADGQVPADAHKLGAVERDKKGDPIVKHRIWDVSRVTDERHVLPDESVVDRLEFELPEGSTAASVEAVWNYRRPPPAFAEWVFHGDPPDFPVRPVARGSWVRSAE